MKKRFFVLVLTIFLIFVFTKRDSGYVIEGNISVDGQNLPFKSYIHDKKWCTEYTVAQKVKYTFLYNGKGFYSYNSKNKLVSGYNFNENEILQRNPINPILNWKNGGSMTTKIPESNLGVTKISTKRTKVNGFDCMMINLSKSRTACVSEEYGFAVYLRYVFPNGTASIVSVENIEPLKNNSVFKVPRDFKRSK